MFFFMLGWHVLVWSFSCFFYSSLYFLIWLPVRALLIPAWAIFLMSLSAACRAQGHRDTHWRVGRSSCCNWDKYIWQLGQIYFFHLGQTHLKSGQIHLTIGTNTFYNWDKYIFHLGQTHLKSGQIHLAIPLSVELKDTRAHTRVGRSSKEGCRLRCVISENNWLTTEHL